jgi:hypothetical protein
VAAELIADLERIYQRKKAANTELRDLVAATGTSLIEPHGIGPLQLIGTDARLPTGERSAPAEAQPPWAGRSAAPTATACAADSRPDP